MTYNCEWCGQTNEHKPYIRFCHQCYERWEFLKEIGDLVMKNTLEGKDTTAKEILEMKERNDDFNRRWNNGQEWLKKMGVIK